MPLFSRCLLSTYFVPGTVRSSGRQRGMYQSAEDKVLQCRHVCEVWASGGKGCCPHPVGVERSRGIGVMARDSWKTPTTENPSADSFSIFPSFHRTVTACFFYPTPGIYYAFQRGPRDLAFQISIAVVLKEGGGSFSLQGILSLSGDISDMTGRSTTGF